MEATTDYEESTAFLGQFGCFQRVVFVLLCASTVPNGFSAFSVVFLAAAPQHHCLVPGDNLTEEWRRAAIPREVLDGREQLSRCSRYRLDVVRNLSALGYAPGRDVNLTQVGREGCLDGWSYSQETYQSTIVTEFNLVCSDDWKQPFTSSIYFLGVLCGSFFSGQLSDRFGRKPVLFTTMAVQTVFTFLQIFSPSWLVFSILFFIIGLGQISNYVAAFVLGTEILTGKVRVLYASLGVCLCFACGYMMLPVFAFLLRDWTSLLLALSLPGLLYIPLWWFIPESPRWLLSQGRVEEAEAILRQAARKNKVDAPRVIFSVPEVELREGRSNTEEHHSVLDLLRNSTVRTTTAILCLMWFTLSTSYFALSLNTANMNGDPYINCLISAAMEVPAYVLSWLALRSLSRRLSASGSMLLSSVALYLIQLVPPSLPDIAVALEMLGKFGAATGTALAFAYTGELYPTVIRNTAVGVCAMVSRVGSAVAPYFIQLSLYNTDLPNIVLGTLTVLSSLAILFLPETFGRPLPETIQDMNKIGRIKCPCTTAEDKEVRCVEEILL